MTPEQIADAQRRLGLLPNGVADDELRLAVRAFQMQAGLLVTGHLDDVTYHTLWETRLLRGGPSRQTGEMAGLGPAEHVTTAP